jgi:hypothetical protein
VFKCEGGEKASEKFSGSYLVENITKNTRRGPALKQSQKI